MNIKGYLMSVVFASALGIVCDLMVVSYGKNGKNIEKHVKLAVTLCILACILMPAIKSADYGELFDMTRLETEAASGVNAQDSLYILRSECEEKVSEYIFAKIGIKPIDVSIEMELQDGTFNPYITESKVKIKKEDSDFAQDICSVAREALNAEVEIIYEE